MRTYVFPGQGSQKKGMGKQLFATFPEIITKANDILGYSIEDLCVRDPDRLLNKTKYTQPALYIINSLTWLQMSADEGMPDYVVGHSLGEYNALFAAGVFDFETGLKLVQERGRLFSQAQAGGMAAIIGANREQIESIINQSQFKHLSVANYNSPSQIVISGAKDDIANAAPYFKEIGARYIILNVSGAFHSPLMATASEEFGKFLTNFTFNDPIIPVISNVTAQPYENKNMIHKQLQAQIISPVRWTESIDYIRQQGDMTYQELGPGNVLSKFITAIEQQPVVLTQNDSKKATSNQSNEKNQITALTLGSRQFKQAYHLKYAYMTGAMVHGIASKELVIAAGKSGIMGHFGTGGLSPQVIESEIIAIAQALEGKPFGMNLLHTPEDLIKEEELIDLYLKHQVKNIEASAFMQMTPALVKYRLSGLHKTTNNEVVAENKIMGKVSRPELAEAFFSPAPKRIVDKLLEAGKIIPEQAMLAENVPMADALCVEADSGGHTDQGVASALLPAILVLRSEIIEKYAYKQPIFVGAAGGIGTPEAAAAAFVLGADFILTGSINQCTVEANTSDLTKDMLCQINVQDTDYAPAGDMFEIGARVQVLRKGVFFPARANKLYSLYKQYDSLDDIDQKTKQQIEKLYFKKSFDEVYEETKAYWQKKGNMVQIDKAEKNPKHKMALIFRWYFGYSNQAALSGSEADKVNFQIHTGPALGAFNQWVKQTELKDWRNRHVDEIGIKLMIETAALLNKRFTIFCQSQ